MRDNPFDDLIGCGGQNAPARSWIRRTGKEKFEEQVVQYLLEYYQLWKTRTRFRLVDLSNNSRADSGKRNLLELSAFNYCFPKFPIRLSSCHLNKKQTAHLDVRRFLLHPRGTAMFRAYQAHCESFGALSRNDRGDLGLVVRWPYVSVEESLVMHKRKANASVPGLHMLWSFDSRERVMIEPLSVLLAAIDSEDPKCSWKKSAIYSDYDYALASNETMQDLHR